MQTEYIVQNCGKYLAIGSDFVHDLLSIDRNTLEIKTDFIVKRSEPKWARMIEAIENLPRDVLREIMILDDEIKNPLPVFTWRDNQIHETQTVDYEWPNTDHKGYILYTNSTFKTEKECVEYARRQATCSLEYIENQMNQTLKEAQKVLEWIKEYRKDDKYLSEIEAKYR